MCPPAVFAHGGPRLGSGSSLLRFKVGDPPIGGGGSYLRAPLAPVGSLVAPLPSPAPPAPRWPNYTNGLVAHPSLDHSTKNFDA